MKFLLAQFIIIVFLTNTAHAQIRPQRPPVDHIDNIYMTQNEPKRDMSNTTWYMLLNLGQYRSSAMDQILNQNKLNISDIIPIQLDKSFPKGIDHIQIFGDSSAMREKKHAFFKGSFSDQEILDYLDRSLTNIKAKTSFIKDTPISYKQSKISVYSEPNSNEQRFATRLREDLFYLSNDLTSVKSKIQTARTHPQSIQLEQKKDLMVFVIDNRTLKQNLKSPVTHQPLIKSQLFMLTDHILASINIIDSQLVINSVLTTQSDDDAIQIEKILNGILALQTEAPSSFKSQILKNMKIERIDKNIQLLTGWVLSSNK